MSSLEDYFDTTARIDDRMEALARTLLDPNLSQELKVAELQSALDRIGRLEAQRPLAENLSTLADVLAGPGEK